MQVARCCVRRVAQQCARAVRPRAVFNAFAPARQCTARRGAQCFATSTDSPSDPKALEGRVTLLEGMLQEADPDIAQICESMSELSQTPQALGQIFARDMPRQLMTAQNTAGEKGVIDAALMTSICRTIDRLDVAGVLFPSDHQKRQAIGQVTPQDFGAAFNSCALGLTFVFRVDAYVASADTIEAACTGLLNLTAEPDMAEAVTEIVGNLAGHEGQQTMIEGKIYMGGWEGLLEEATQQYDGDTAAGQALQQLRRRFGLK